jgi:hypothetical protein
VERRTMLRIIAMSLVISASSVASAACELTGGQKVESDRYVMGYRTKPAKLAVGQHFSVELAVCAKEGQPAPEAVRVDGFMPDHNHGMNYRPTVKALKPGFYQADGMMFHMPGRWDFIFEVRAGGKSERITHSVVLQ